jgi:hypothetical protein
MPAEMAGVMPVQWNPAALAKAAYRSITPGSIVAMADPARLTITLLPRWAVPASMK